MINDVDFKVLADPAFRRFRLRSKPNWTMVRGALRLISLRNWLES